jgi:hypothetical protein
MGRRRSFAHVGKNRFLTVASRGVFLRVLPTWGKFQPMFFLSPVISDRTHSTARPGEANPAFFPCLAANATASERIRDT